MCQFENLIEGLGRVLSRKKIPSFGPVYMCPLLLSPASAVEFEVFAEVCRAPTQLIMGLDIGRNPVGAAENRTRGLRTLGAMPCWLRTLELSIA